MTALKRSAWLFALALALGCGRPEPATKIGIVQLVEEPQVDMARQGVIEVLAEAGYAEGKDFGIVYRNAQGELGNLAMICEQFKNDRVKLVVASTTPCLVGMAKALHDVPIVFTVCSPPDEVGLKPVPANVSGYYNPLDLHPFFGLVRECVPGIRRIGHIYNPAEVNASFASERIKKVCAELGLELIQVTVASNVETPQAAQTLAVRKAQCIVISADNIVYAGLPAIGKAAAAVKLPIFVTDPCIVGNGAALGYGLDYKEWGRLTGRMAVQILRGERLAEPVVRPNTEYRLYVNRRACEEQGLVLPEAVKARVAKYY